MSDTTAAGQNWETSFKIGLHQPPNEYSARAAFPAFVRGVACHPLCLRLCTFLCAISSLCRLWMLRSSRLLAALERSWPDASAARNAATELLPSTRLILRGCAQG